MWLTPDISVPGDGRSWEGPGFVLGVEPLDDVVRARLVAAGERVSDLISEVIDEASGRGGPSSVVRHMDWAFMGFGTTEDGGRRIYSAPSPMRGRADYEVSAPAVTGRTDRRGSAPGPGGPGAGSPPRGA